MKAELMMATRYLNYGTGLYLYYFDTLKAGNQRRELG